MAVYSKVYDSYAQAESAVRDLEQAGIPSADISLVANKYVSEQYADVNETSATSTGIGLGAAAGGGAGLLAGLGLLAIPGLGPVVAAARCSRFAPKPRAPAKSSPFSHGTSLLILHSVGGSTSRRVGGNLTPKPSRIPRAKPKLIACGAGK